MKVRITLPSPPPAMVRIKISPPTPVTTEGVPAPAVPKFKKGDPVRTIGGFHRSRSGDLIRIPTYTGGSVRALAREGDAVYVEWSGSRNPEHWVLQWHAAENLEIDDPKTRQMPHRSTDAAIEARKAPSSPKTPAARPTKIPEVDISAALAEFDV